ncbi:hypothetical protein BDW62DRAFT_200484 [Aspergillus aurantiobrunneus]
MDPTAPSLLWAHELRRENVQLLSQMDKLNTILYSATNAITTLHKSVDVLTARVQQLEEQREVHRSEVDDRIHALAQDTRESSERGFGEVHARVGVLEQENGGLRGHVSQVSQKFGALETENGGLKGEIMGVFQKFGALEQENRKLREEVREFSQKLGALETDNERLRVEVKGFSQKFSALEAEDGKLVGDVGKVSEKFDVLETGNRKLKEEVDEMSKNFGTLETENGTLKWNLDIVLRTFERIEGENEELKKRICVLEKEASVQEKQVARLMKWMSMRTMGDDKDRDKRGPVPASVPGTRSKRTQADQSQDIHRIPDSIPTPPSRYSTRAGPAYRTLSETTWGSLTDLEGPCSDGKRAGNSPLRKEITKSDPEDHKTLESICQEGRTLNEYLQLTEALRARHPSIPEEMLVTAFIGGFDDEDLRKRIFNLTRHSGLSWESVVSFVQGAIIDSAVLGKVTGEKRGDKSMDVSAKREAASRPVNKREEKRRTIPIVPVDEEDELFVT